LVLLKFFGYLLAVWFLYLKFHFLGLLIIDAQDRVYLPSYALLLLQSC
jgi:hypothetical protein